jgi:selenide,water dikinase
MKRLVLAGGGHAHVEVLRRLRQAPIDALEMVLVSPHADTPYSGMLPGLVAGLYKRGETHIALPPLVRFSGARFVTGRVTEIHAASNAVVVDGRDRIEYDLLSLDIGSTPATGDVPGAAEHAIGVKPVDVFLGRFAALLEDVRARRVRRIAVVGGGAAGVEMLLAMRHRLGAAGVDDLEWVLATDAPALLPTHAQKVRDLFARELAVRAIEVRVGWRASRVQPGRLRGGPAPGDEIAADVIVWATGAGAPALLAASALARDAAGFVTVGETLQSTSHANVFAAGDVATVVGHPRPRSGVYAVRQGPPLAHNLRAAVAGDAMVRHVPQRRALAIITTGGRHAVATRGDWAVAGGWVWRWKDWIDRRFMARYARDR